MAATHMREPRFGVGQILSDSGDLTLQALQRASIWQRRHGGTIERALLETGAVGEEALTAALSRSCGFPGVLRERLERAEPDVVTMLPAASRRRLRALPFDLSGNALHVAAADPKNPVLETGLIASTGHDVTLYVVADPILDDVLALWAAREGATEDPLPVEPEDATLGPDPFERLARALLADTLHVEATELELGTDRAGGFARSVLPGMPPLTRRFPAAVVAPLLDWFRDRSRENGGLAIDWTTLEDVPRRLRARVFPFGADGLRLSFEAARTRDPKTEECPHDRSETNVFCPLCGAAL